MHLIFKGRCRHVSISLASEALQRLLTGNFPLLGKTAVFFFFVFFHSAFGGEGRWQLMTYPLQRTQQPASWSRSLTTYWLCTLRANIPLSAQEIWVFCRKTQMGDVQAELVPGPNRSPICLGINPHLPKEMEFWLIAQEEGRHYRQCIQSPRNSCPPPPKLPHEPLLCSAVLTLHQSRLATHSQLLRAQGVWKLSACDFKWSQLE